MAGHRAGRSDWYGREAWSHEVMQQQAREDTVRPDQRSFAVYQHDRERKVEASFNLNQMLEQEILHMEQGVDLDPSLSINIPPTSIHDSQRILSSHCLLLT